ncbi:MAG: aminotransferase class V-fold PLP-dependent enzyme [Alcaligenaceae bacterium]|nr:MAG: aminotransferase class V-fold PLP-dependent enzyme [Alcaligenaceae bacterium]
MLSDFRAQFPSLDARVHLASCSYAPRSTMVSSALEEMLLELEQENPWTVYEQKVAQLRVVLAELLNCQVRQIGLLPNATISAYQVASSIDWSAKPRIIASTAEFPSIAQVWKAQESRGAEVILVESHPGAEDIMNAYRRVLDERVGLISIPAIDYLSGAKLPVPEIAMMARRLGVPSICDAYQAVGTEPVNAQEIGVDYLVAGSMKYLLGLPGIAFLYARQPESVQRISELTGWQARVDPFEFSPWNLDLPDSARRFETGTPAIAAIYAAIAGIRALLDANLLWVAERISALKRHAIQAFLANGLNLRYLAAPQLSGGHFSILADDSKALVRHLLQRRIQVSLRLDAVRIAFHAFNRHDDVDELCESLVAARDGGIF